MRLLLLSATGRLEESRRISIVVETGRSSGRDPSGGWRLKFGTKKIFGKKSASTVTVFPFFPFSCTYSCAAANEVLTNIIEMCSVHVE